MKTVVTTRDDLSKSFNRLDLTDACILDNCSSSAKQKALLFSLGFSAYVYRTRCQLSSRSLALSAMKLAFSISEEEHALVISSKDLKEISKKIQEIREDFIAIGDCSFIVSRKFFKKLESLGYFNEEPLPLDKDVSSSLIEICKKCELTYEDTRAERSKDSIKQSSENQKLEVEVPKYRVISPIPTWKERALFDYQDL